MAQWHRVPHVNLEQEVICLKCMESILNTVSGNNPKNDYF